MTVYLSKFRPSPLSASELVECGSGVHGHLLQEGGPRGPSSKLTLQAALPRPSNDLSIHSVGLGQAVPSSEVDKDLRHCHLLHQAVLLSLSSPERKAVSALSRSVLLLAGRAQKWGSQGL